MMWRWTREMDVQRLVAFQDFEKYRLSDLEKGRKRVVFPDYEKCGFGGYRTRLIKNGAQPVSEKHYSRKHAGSSKW